LQCNSGQDTLSLAALGAQVTGVDISDEAVAFARALSVESGIPGTFERADVYDWLAAAEPASFDLVFCSYGAIYWLSDIAQWGRGVARVLRGGGRIVTVDAHPLMMVFGETFNLQYMYSGGAEVPDPGVHDYVASAGTALTPSGWEEGVKDFKNPHPNVGFQWGLSELVMALVEPGLRLEVLAEYHNTKWKAFPVMVPGENGGFVLPPGMSNIPLLLGLVASKR
jgi:SAM-dependent methyltransferase